MRAGSYLPTQRGTSSASLRTAAPDRRPHTASYLLPVACPRSREHDEEPLQRWRIPSRARSNSASAATIAATSSRVIYYGQGGSVAFADPSCGLPFAYLSAQEQLHLGADPRTETLAHLARDCALGRLGRAITEPSADGATQGLRDLRQTQYARPKITRLP